MKNREPGIKKGGINIKGINGSGISVTMVIAAAFILALTAMVFTPRAFFPMEAMTGEPEAAAATESESGPGDDSRPRVRAAESAARAAEASAIAAEAAAKIATTRGDGNNNNNNNWRRLVDEKTMKIYLGESDWNFIGVMTLRFVMNILFAYVLISLIYSREHRIREYSFSFFVSNILIFMVTSLLASVRVRTGFAFGLFAILSILRYRTEQIQIREMTFLFASIILGVINSLATADLTIFAVLWANVILCMFVYLCDQVFMGQTDQILLVYDNTKLLGKDKKKELHEDIKNRFGYDVVKVVIIKMNYLTDSAEVKLVYKRK
ncbi:MAG: DUF4956 domain-containing protein [Chitinispirillia bacterium]|nr:DUF4956 domain-containing protein [Chitinispirillia bacterium]MCL2268050.1 DUF4956 domain-containing protein [Chitinispirillia bacterium]